MRVSLTVLGFLVVSLGWRAMASAQTIAENSAAPPDSKGALVGTIMDKKGKGVAGATVKVDNGAGFTQSVTTDGQGLYAVMDMSAGKYTIDVVASGAEILRATANLSPGQVLTLGVTGADPGKVQAAQSKVTLAGTVTDQTGTGVAGATVAVDNGAGFTQSLTTDSQGAYGAKDLPVGSYTITVTAGGAKIFRASTTLNAGQTLTLGVGGSLVAQADVIQSLPSQVASGSTSSPPAPPLPASLLPENPPPMPIAPKQAGTTGGSGTGSFSGAVSDQTGAVVVGATVKLVNSTGTVQTAVSDDKGNYSIKGLTPGSYNFIVAAPGFKTFEADNIALAAGQELPIDAALEPAGEKTEVNVEGSKVAEVETENAQVSGTITEKEVSTLALNGRNFTQLIALTPGVSNQTGQDEAKVGVTGSVKYSVNGGRVEYNTFEVDGSDVLNAGLNGAESTLMVYPSLDAIQEVKVLTSNYGAQYGRTASGTVIVTTKSGGAQWHGDGYEFLRNEVFNARNYFDQTASAPLYRRNDFGFTIGGPLYIPGHYNTKKDKTFIFWSEEFRIENSPSDLQPDFNRGVPSLAERQGDFNDVCPGPGTNTTAGLFDRSKFPDCPSSGFSSSSNLLVPFPGNNLTTQIGGTVSPGSLDRNAIALLSTNLIPLPNASGGCNSSIGSCYVAVISEPTHWREELFRIDHNFNSKIRASFRYIHDSWDTQTPVPEWGSVQNSFPTVQNKFVGPGLSMIVHLTETITPTLLNEFTASYTDAHITLKNVNGPGGANYQRPASLGTPGGPCTPTLGVPDCPLGAIFNNGFGGKAPGLVFQGNNQEYGGNGFAADTSYMPWEHTNPTFSFRDDVSKVLGKHTLQFGAQLIYSQRNENNGAIGAATGDVQGLLTFSNISTGGFTTGNAFANFLVFLYGSGQNLIQSYTQDSEQHRYYNRYFIGEPYAQDDWRINSRLTVNVGVRFSLFGLFHEKYNNAYNWESSAFSPALAAQVSVNPATGQLVNGPGGTGAPIPINLSNPDPRITNGLVQCGVKGVPAGCMTGHLFNPAPRVGFAWDPRGDGKTSIRAGYGIFYEHGTPEEANTGSLEGSAPLVLNMTQRLPQSYGCIGGSAGTGGACTTLPGAFPINVTSIPTHAVWPYAQQWSFSIQRELPKGLLGTIAYVGSKGTNLTVERQLNQIKPVPSALNPFGPNEPIIPLPGGGQPGSDCGAYSPNSQGVTVFHLLNGTTVGPQDPAYINLEAACFGSNIPPLPATPNPNTLRPYPGIGEILALQNVANSSYNALQTTLRRTKGGLTIGGSYTYSHGIDDSSDRSDSTFVNSYDLRSNRASSNFDQRHLLNVSYIYSLPDLGSVLSKWGSGHGGEPTGDSQDTQLPPSPSRFLRLLGDGWQFSGITIFQSGTPFSVINNGSGTISTLDNAGVANGVGSGSYPDVVAHPAPLPDETGNTKSFGPLLGNPNMFVAPRGLTFGDAGRNFFNNPHRTNFDMSLLKHFQIKESGVLEVRAEAFNVFNHTQFRIYNPDLGNTGSNTISCYGGPNYSAGFAAVGGTDCVTGSAFLHPVDAHRPRTIQLGVKYKF